MSNPAFTFERYRAHGWVVHRKMLKAGETFVVNVPQGYTLEQAPDIALWTRGYVTGVNLENGEPVEPRSPGSSILRRMVMLPGKHLMTAQEDSEFWCVNRIANRNRLPGLEVVDLAPTEVQQIGLPSLICSGRFKTLSGDTIEAPAALAAGATITAETRVLGLAFKEN